MRCRICGRDCSFMGWNKHVEMHKRVYCRENGLPEQSYYNINWEDVVMFFNPKNANEKKTSGFVPKPIHRKLCSFDNVHKTTTKNKQEKDKIKEVHKLVN